MPSANKTLNYDLNQWAGNEYPMRTDFVEDNAKVDTAIKGVDDKAENLDQRVNELEENLNNPETLSTSLTLYEQLKTFLDSYASPADFRIGGASLYNAAKATNGLSLSVVAGTTYYLKIDGGITASADIQRFSTKNGEKFFVKVKFKPTSTAKINRLTLNNGVSAADANFSDSLEGSAILIMLADNSNNFIGFRAATTGTLIIDSAFHVPLTGTPYEIETSPNVINALVNDYFEGLQSAESFEVGSRGKNLFDGIVDIGDIGSATGLDIASTTRQRTGFYKIKPSTQYIVTPSSTTNSFQGAFVYDKNKQPILELGGATSYFVLNGVAFTTPSNAHYVKFRTTEILTEEEINTIMLNEGATALSYEPYQGSLATVTAKRHKLTNLVEDELKFVDGRWQFIKRVNEDFNQILKNITGWTISDDDGVNHSFRITASTFFTDGLFTQTDLSVLIQIGSIFFNTVTGNFNNPYTVYITSGNTLRIKVPKATFPDVASFNTFLQSNDVKFFYQFATPIIIDEADFNANGIDVQGSLSSNLDYTEFFVNDYDMFTEPTIEYAGNISQAVVNLKEIVDSLKLSSTQQNLINLEFDARLTILEP